MKWRLSIGLMTSWCRQPSDLWSLVPLSLLIVGLGARIVAGAADWLYHDTYFLMYGVDGSFAEYVLGEGYGLQLHLHYWITYRLLGGSLSAYMASTILSSLATLLVVYWGLRHYWRSDLGLCFFALLVLVFSNVSLWLVQFALFAYANTLFVSTCLFFLFIRLSQGKLPARQWAWFTILIAPAALFTDARILVPIVTGAVSVMAVRYWQVSGYRSVSALWRSLLEMWPLILFPLLLLSFHLIKPKLSGALSAAYLDQYIFGRADYASSIVGAVQFIAVNSYTLIVDLLSPSKSPLDVTLGVRVVWALLILALLSIMVVLALRMWQRRLDRRMSFVLVFTTVTFAALIAGAMLGMTPYGSPRYAYYCLLLPLSILIGYACSSLLRQIGTKLPMVKQSKLIPVFLALTVLVLGMIYNARCWHHNSSITEQNQGALHEFGTAEVDLVLFTPYQWAVLRASNSQLWESGINIGWGMNATFSRDSQDVVPDDMIKALTTDGDCCQPQTILVIALDETELRSLHPSWYELIDGNFLKVKEFPAPSIWGAVYARK